jgi:tetratricopeptide (TPR) repeat protein
MGISVSMRFVAAHLLLFLLASAANSRILYPQRVSVGRAPYVIYGNVQLPDGSPGRGAVVRVTNSSGLDRQTLVDNSGRYELRDLPRGHYYVSASNPDDSDQFSDYTEIDFSQSRSLRVIANLFLRYRPEKTAQQPARSPVISVKESSQRVPKEALKAFNHGIKCSHERKLEQAEQDFTRALVLFPDYFQALSERGSLLIARGRVPEASRDFEHALQIDPEYGPALRGSGICKLQAGNYGDAAKDLERAIAAEPNVPRDYIFLGMAYAAIDQREPARAAFQHALSLDPQGSARAHFHLANLDIRENRPGEAIRELDAYLAAVPDAPDREKVLALRAQLRQKK